MALDQLLGPEARTAFTRHHYLKLPYSVPGGCAGLTPLGSWEVVEEVLRSPEVDALVGRDGQRWEGQLPPSPEQARVLLAEGYTLGIRHAERHHRGLADLADGFRRDFLAPIDVHLYCTPAGHPGFGWHYDAEDVFILQTRGSKEWNLRKNTVNPWPLVETMPADLRYERELMPLMRCTLKAGDWLYIPAGYWHSTRAGEDSISLSVGIRSTTCVDVYDFLRRELLSSLLWRQRLPTPGPASALSEEELFRHYQTVFAELGADLARALGREEFVRSFLAEQRRSVSGE